MAATSTKIPHCQLDEEDDDESQERFVKAKRNDLDPPISEVDIRLAEKLDKILQIGATRKPIFHTNKPRKDSTVKDNSNGTKIVIASDGKLKARNLTKDELRERLIKRYDTLVPELDPKRPGVKLVKILSVSESMGLAVNQAKKQMERQMELSSVSGNQLASSGGTKTFRFNDGYEMPANTFSNSNGYRKSTLISKRIAQLKCSKAKPLDESSTASQQPTIYKNRQTNKNPKSKTVRFNNDVQVENNSRHSDESESESSGSEDDETLTESDCSTTVDDDDDDEDEDEDSTVE